MATVIPIGEPINETERRAIAHLRDLLPKSYLIFHNFEIRRADQNFEIDLDIIAPHAALAGLSPKLMAHLRSGEAYVWSSKSSDDAFSSGAVNVMRCRPRSRNTEAKPGAQSGLAHGLSSLREPDMVICP